MINSLFLKDFKCFREADIMISPLTLLTGLNSSGKSSIIQAIRIALGRKLLDGHGDCVSILGTEAEITLEVNDSKYSTKIERNTHYVKHFGNIPEASDFTLQYIGADRVGPANYLPYRQKMDGVGDRGENVISYLTTVESGVPERIRRDGYELYSGVKEQTKKWLEIISPGLDFDYELLESIDIALVKYSDFRPFDVGFGLPYTLPIIVTTLISTVQKAKNPEKDIILCIENPEAHLHPRGQTELGVFLSLAASCGLQIIVETHSDHLINGVRIAVKDKQLDPADAIIHFFEYSPSEEQSKHYPIFIEERGVIDHWPEGFFDENEKNLLRLL